MKVTLVPFIKNFLFSAILTIIAPLANANLNPPPFVPTENLKPRVSFWIKIFTQYHTKQGLIHDAKYFDHIYEIIDLTDSDRENKRRIRHAENKWREVLRSLYKKAKKTRGDLPPQLSTDELQVWKLFSDVPGSSSKFNEAQQGKRLRTQLGQKDRFIQGLIESGKYLPRMEQIFKDQGVPPELTRIAFVESSFNTRARSKVGASGVFQLMRATGKRYLYINSSVDQRNDPFQAAEAAARFLRTQYEMLENWAITVTAYNHGPAGMVRAIHQVGGRDIDAVVERYHSPHFKFASQNFYAEFLAALTVEAQAEKYFGKVQRLKPDRYFEIELEDAMKLRDLCDFMNYDIDEVRNLNPGFSTQVKMSGAPVPARALVRLPLGKLTEESAKRVFASSYEKIAPIFKLKHPRLRVKH